MREGNHQTNVASKQVIDQVTKQAKLAQVASRKLALLTSEQKNAALRAIKEQLLADQAYILAENKQDVDKAIESGQLTSLIDRLSLTPERITALADSLEDLVALADPIGETTSEWVQKDGLAIRSVRVPLGVIGMIYEARPNVTVDAAAISLKTGNAVVLRGSASTTRSNLALVKSIQTALQNLGLPHEAVQYLATTDRAAVDVMCSLHGIIDVIIPRGGASLINRVVKNSIVPVIETGVGNCHIFIDQSADSAMAQAIVQNAKLSRPAVCNALESLLIHQDFGHDQSAALLTSLLDAGVELRVCERTMASHPELRDRFVLATEPDWHAEFLDTILAVKTVTNIDEALEHIATYGTKHSESILTEDQTQAERFLQAVDAAVVYHNASTRFTDGGEFGFGAEIGISTQKLHARGPMGLTALTSIKYRVLGNGQTR
ncbi:glutamate-5-semialdehyde dehydrogenase [Brevibacillus laterosporus]|uniref:glutamate-5-semialdehyde dehydrogenase n=1 Tax=Brevibacillus laterosporus TaxID=1465 RepID=UPI00215BFE8F|nr:glutamate-5-semialdehyde dehydrogenase [Brevibacillus laterosporus]MCR8995907.1 glutamate-5-semialdehyde dehydrogenase [Brevibacillus laterosporus]